ncbi:MAG TPA: glycine rich domain-containing protein [Candidatus Cybelea sp.]|nr:glycine rich domain-containing protein [Candidatus Cybelea sp.]
MRLTDFGGVYLRICLAAAILVGCAGHTDGEALPALDGANAHFSHHRTFHFTGTVRSFMIPANVKLINVVALGAGGGPTPYPTYNKSHGRGGRVHAVIPVTPGQTLYVVVGGEGYNGIAPGGTGFNGGATGGLIPYCGRSGYKCYGFGGGGASDVRVSTLLRDRIIVAGGGGGAGSWSVSGGGGGGKIGGDGGSGYGYYRGGGGGGGGTQSHGGAGGAGQTYGSYGSGGDGSPGTLGQGGNGGEAGATRYCSSSCEPGAGGGGGGGYYGGGGGGGACTPSLTSPVCGLGGGGGGGSSYAEPRARNVRMWRNWNTATGNGLVVLSW